MAKREKKFFRDCPKCGKQLGHVSAKLRDYAAKKNGICKSCSNRRALKGMKFSAKAKANMSAGHQKSIKAIEKLYGKNPEYVYYGDLSKWANQVKERDNYQCQCCGAKDLKSTKIHSHHIVPKEYFIEMAVNVSNGISLCISCHKKIHGKLNKIFVSGTKLTPVGFQDHAKQFIAEGKASSQTTQTPPVYKSVFSPSVTIVKE